MTGWTLWYAAGFIGLLTLWSALELDYATHDKSEDVKHLELRTFTLIYVLIYVVLTAIFTVNSSL